MKQSILLLQRFTPNTIKVLGAQFSVSLYSNAFYLMLNSVVSALLGFAFWLIVARYYSAVDVGLATAIIAVTVLLANLSNLGLGFGLIRFLPTANDKATPMINSSLTIVGLVSLATSLIFLAGISLWSPAIIIIREDPIFLISFILFTITFSLYNLLNQVFIAKRTAKHTFIQSVTASATKIPILIIFTAFFGVFGIFASAGIAISVAILVSILWFLPRIQKSYVPILTIRKQTINKLARYSFGNYLANLLWIAPGLLFPLMVVNILGAEMNAYFYIAWAIAVVLFMIPQSISLSLFAEGSYKRNLLRANTVKSLKLCLFISIPVILLIFIIGDKLLLLFGDAYSQNAATLLNIFALSTLPLCVNYILLSIWRVQNDIKSILVMSLTLASIVLGLSYFLMGSMDILGVGVGWIMGQTIVAVVFGTRFAMKLWYGR